MKTGERIIYYRTKNNMSQNMLAEKAGISQSHLRRVELDQSRITVDLLELICDALGITLKDFFDTPDSNNEISSIVSNLTSTQKQRLLEFLKTL